jgi:hypothetical protein
MKKSLYFGIMVVFLIASVLGGCDGGGGGGRENPPGPVNDAYKAKSAAEIVYRCCEKVEQQLPYTKNTLVTLTNQRYDSPRSGYCLVNGTTQYSYSSSTSYGRTASITITFYSWREPTYDPEDINQISGSMSYYHYESYSSESVSIQSASAVQILSDFGEYVLFNLEDSVTFNLGSSGIDILIPHGTLTSSSGTYSF